MTKRVDIKLKIEVTLENICDTKDIETFGGEKEFVRALAGDMKTLGEVAGIAPYEILDIEAKSTTIDDGGSR